MLMNKIINAIKKAHNIAILPHVSADGDALGSSFALAIALKGLGKNATIYLEEDIPFIYGFMPGLILSKVYNGTDNIETDVAVALDTGDLQRLGKRRAIFEKSSLTVNIDHHTTNSMFATLNHVIPYSSASAEIIYQMIKSMGINLNGEMALCLYVAIATDTGGFRYANTTAITHQITADLINNGVDIADTSQKVFDTISHEKLKLISLGIQNLEFHENGKIAVMTVTREMLEKSGALDEDCDIVGLGRNVKGVEIAVMLREKDNGEIKVNLRSNTDFDVARLAASFSGGGHKKASGFSAKGHIEDVKSELLCKIKQSL